MRAPRPPLSLRHLQSVEIRSDLRAHASHSRRRSLFRRACATGAVSGHPSSACDLLPIPEDDWRQIEFISKDQKSSIDTEIDSINYIFEHKIHKGPHYVSFKEIRVRRLIKQPLSIPIGRILNYLGDGEIKQSGLNILNNSGA